MALITPRFPIVEALKADYGFWRETATWTSQADYIEIEVVPEAIIIGPSSTWDEYLITYIDPNNVSFQNTIVLSVANPIDFRIEARLGFANRTGAIAGKIRIQPRYAVSTTLTEATFDIICFLKAPAGQLVTSRAPNSTLGTTTQSTVGSNQTVFTVPNYGRSSIWFALKSAKALTDWTLNGIHYDAAAGTVGLTHPITTGNTLAIGVTASYVLGGARFNAYQLTVSSTGTDAAIVTYAYELTD